MKSSRQEILDSLRKTKLVLPDSPDFDSPVYHPIGEPLETAFKKNLEAVNGSVYLCNTDIELANKLTAFLSRFTKNTIYCFEENLQNILNLANISFTNNTDISENIEAGITGCEFLIAHTGSVMVSSAQKGGRKMFVYPPVHIIIARKNQLVDYLDKAYKGISDKYKSSLPSQITLITGPSRTADIEKTLVMGAHGPRELHVFLY
jgi:L-lactate dehydrogenase complex protein LldG